MSDLILRDDKGRLRFRWSSLIAVPPTRNSWPYRRLRHVWFDHTWPSRPFFTPGSEIHLTATLFENFTIFDPADWIPAFLRAAGFTSQIDGIHAANWGYEIHDAPSNKLADAAIHYRDAAGDGIIVVEAKKRGGSTRFFGAREWRAERPLNPGKSRRSSGRGRRWTRSSKQLLAFS